MQKDVSKTGSTTALQLVFQGPALCLPTLSRSHARRIEYRTPFRSPLFEKTEFFRQPEGDLGDEGT